MFNQKKIQEVIDDFKSQKNDSNVVQFQLTQQTLPLEIKKLLEENNQLIIKDLQSALDKMKDVEHQLLCKASEYCSTDQFNDVVECLENVVDESNFSIEKQKYNWAQAFIMIHTLKDSIK